MKRALLLPLLLSHALPAFGLVGDLVFRDGFEIVAQISVLPTPAFAPQLVSTASAPLTVTITNVGAVPLTISEIGNSGGDASDFMLDQTGTQLTLASTASTTLKVTFHPLAPWQPGTRQAQLNVLGNVSGGVLYAAESGMGVTCAGPVPACSSGCADTDGDGLNDAWEIAGGIDINNDGVIDAQHDALLPGADPNKPDIFVKYDYMVQTGIGAHSHQPSQAVLDQVTSAFALHGITLHFIAPSGGITETIVTTLDPSPTLACAGTSVSTMHDLRLANFDHLQPAYHYMVFAHFATCPNTASCTMCPADPNTGATPDPTGTGSSDLPGDDVIIAAANTNGIENLASTIMHELGHNFGLKHGGDESVNDKPNYISVMNYAYQAPGIPVADALGSTNPLACSVDTDYQPPTISTGPCATAKRCFCSSQSYCYRVDYSNVLYGSLNEAHLNETLGFTNAPTSRDIGLYFVPGSPTVQLLAATNGNNVDWNNLNGNMETDVAVDLNNSGGPPEILHSFVDWSALNLRYQCTAGYGKGAASAWATDEGSGGRR